MLKKMWRYFIKKPNSDYIFATSAIIIIIISSILSTAFVPYFDKSISDKESELATANANIDLLNFDYNDHKTWESQSLILRNDISLLNSMSLFNLSNSAQIVDTIEDRERDLLTTQVAGLEALTRHIETNEVINKTQWNYMTFDELQTEKAKVEKVFNDVYSYAIENKKTLESEVATFGNQRSTVYNFIPPTYILGFLFSQFAVLIHWKKSESKNASRNGDAKT
jgi:hypothetical protein